MNLHCFLTKYIYIYQYIISIQEKSRSGNRAGAINVHIYNKEEPQLTINLIQ